MEAKDVAAALGPRAAVSHETAARSWGIELVQHGSERLTVPRHRGRAPATGWRVHRSDLASDEVVLVDGVRWTTPMRTVVDLAHVLPLAEAVTAADSALRQELVDHAELVAALSRRRGPGAARARRVARLVDPRAESVLESLLRVLLHLAGLPAPESQVTMHEVDGEVAARVDFAWPSFGLVVEADGFAFHSDRAAYRQDRRRNNALVRLGWRVLRFSWEDVQHEPEDVARTVRACLTPR
ncbi:MAG TPA: DUF559 domain-containing protein [Mycobacteriales bacterium]|jgi:very-short-patch-repair endonuclease|nr:DUF559 domain-containing protein [Mycobacteriales bacterium]